MRFAWFAFVVACSSPQQPAPAPTPVEKQPEVITKDQCEAQGARFNASIGGGDQAHCAADEAEVAPVRFGMEGGWCCKQR